MPKKKSLLHNQLFDKKEGRKSRRAQRRRSDLKMLDEKDSTQRRGTHGVEQITGRRSHATDVNEWRRLDRALRKEMRNFEKVMAKEQQNLK